MARKSPVVRKYSVAASALTVALCVLGSASINAACSGGHGLSSGPVDGGGGGGEGGQHGPGSEGGKKSGEGGAGYVLPYTLTPLTAANASTDFITLFLSVTDANGQGVSGLLCNSSHCDFQYLEDGNPVDPAESAFSVAPALTSNDFTIPTALIIQASPSIFANPGELAQMKAAANAIIDAMAMLPQQKIEVITFADKATPNVRQGFTSDATMLKAAVNGINTPDGQSTNLYGTLDYVLGTDTAPGWRDGFQTDTSTSGKLTAGVAIVITNGSDNAAVDTLGSVITARGNKRVIAVGVGSSTTLNTGALNDIADLGPDCSNSCASGSTQCGCAIITPSFSTLSADVSKITATIASLGKSIYLASYCSPKRPATVAGQTSNHKLTFTVTLNQKYNNVSCSDAIFDEVAAASCDSQVAAGSSATEPCFDALTVVGKATCCPANQPYACPGSTTCYGSASAAAAACASSCIRCGGTGAGATQNDDLVPGTELVVSFDSASYKDGQCPAFWGPSCKGLEACCGTITSSDYNASCTTGLDNALGTESMCESGVMTYCPTGGNCMALESCCMSLPSGTQSQCLDALYSQSGGIDSTCGMYLGTYCPASVPDAGTDGGAQQDATTAGSCASLMACCQTFSGDGEQTCMTDLQAVAGNASGCATLLTWACPAGATSCGSLKSCCEVNVEGGSGSGSSALNQCESDLLGAQGSESKCAGYLSMFGCGI